MIYRVHLPNQSVNEPYGSFVGYVSICYPQSTNFTHIKQSLIFAKLVPEDWMNATPVNNKVAVKTTKSLIPHIHTIYLSRKTGGVIFYLHPVLNDESKRISKEISNNFYSGLKINQTLPLGDMDFRLERQQANPQEPVEALPFIENEEPPF